MKFHYKTDHMQHPVIRSWLVVMAAGKTLWGDRGVGGWKERMTNNSGLRKEVSSVATEFVYRACFALVNTENKIFAASKCNLLKNCNIKKRRRSFVGGGIFRPPGTIS